MIVTLTVSRFGSIINREYETVQEAAGFAVMDVESNDAAPVSIEENDVIVWENKGSSAGSYERLREMANPHPWRP